jgi:16S rRNA (adenine1518-N6/adenine1519-N6)-dimethyltransferase
VVEIGPGPGVLTRALLQAQAKVEAVEIDKQILPVLKEATRSYKDYLTIHEKHVLDYKEPKQPYKLVANIPYHLTSPILRKFLNETENRPVRIVLLVQKEVAGKICEKPGRDSHLSVMVKAFGNPKIVARVPANSFYPVPKVDSAILLIETFDMPQFSISPKIFEQMLFDGFSEPRKKLKNVLMKRFLKTSAEIETVLKNIGVSGDMRAQNLTIRNWEDLAKVLLKKYL